MTCKPCTFEFSRGRGTGVAEAIGNWGFSNEVVSPGHEWDRVKCLVKRIADLGVTTCKPPKKICPTEVYILNHSPPESRPCWTFPKNRPIITYSSVNTILITSDRRVIERDAKNFAPIPERSYCYQRDDKWYKLGALCCPQPSCPAPFIPKVAKLYCYDDCCL